MRHGFQIIASCGIVGMLIAGASADDPLYESDHLSNQYRNSAPPPPSAPQSGAYFSRSGRTGRALNPSENINTLLPPSTESAEERAQRYARLLRAYRSRNQADTSAPQTPTQADVNAYRTQPQPDVDAYRTQTQADVSAYRVQAQKDVDGTKPDVRNYYRELFGSQAQRPQTSTPPSPSRPVAGSYQQPVRENPAVPSGRRSVNSNRSLSFIDTDHTAETAQTSEFGRPTNVINAEHTRPSGATERGRIQPVRATGEVETPIEVVDELTKLDDEAGTKPPEPTTGQERFSQRGTKELTFLPSKEQVSSSSVAARIQSQIEANPEFASLQAAANPSPMVTVQWVKKGEINVGQECRCELVVKNAGKVPAAEVNVDGYFPESVRLISNEPQGGEQGDHLTWHFKSLAPGEEQTIRIGMIPSQRGELRTMAYVRFTGASSGLFTVEEPLLKIAVQGPSEVMLGDPATQLIVVSNAGTGVANNVAVEATIPEGLEHLRGEHLLMKIGSLNPGESRTVKLALAAVNGGEHQIIVQANADGNLKKRIEPVVNVIAPSIGVAIDGPGLRYIGRTAGYVLNVTNEGAAASNNVRVVHEVPEGFQFQGADKGGTYDKTSRTITWFVGRMEPGQKISLNSELSASQIGDHVHRVGAFSEHGSRSENELMTSVAGTASLVLDIVDLDDPVEVDTETAYEIRVRNDGTAAASNVGIACELPAGVELIAAKGPGDFHAEGSRMVFRPLNQLAAGKAAIYRVHVRGRSAGNHRFRVRLVSDSITEPLLVEELTKFYAD